MSILDDVGVGVKRSEGQEFETEDSQFFDEFPGIYEWLARINLRGAEREPASLTIKYLCGGVSLCVSAPAEGVVGWHQAKTIQEALEGLERRLQDGKMDWRERKSGWQKR